MKPRLLISNDDGIGSPFLPIFARELAEVADVEIVVPASEQSWIGRAYSRLVELSAEEVDFCGLKTWTVNGTPADCVNIALSHLCPNPDAVVSGINIGQNIAMPLLWSSGTFGAAAEGAGFGITSFAFSMRLEKRFYDACRLRHEMPEDASLENSVKVASKTASRFILDVLKSKPREWGVVRNVNFPIRYSEDTPFRECVPARAKISPLYVENCGKYNFKYAMEAFECEELTDYKCLENNEACYSVINI